MDGPVWLVLPTYDEADNVDAIVRAAVATLARAAPGSHHVLIVDDSSPDGTGKLADALAGELAAVEVLHRPRKGGLGPAYLAGFDRALEAGAAWVLQMDADFSHDPADLARLLAAARQGADLVLGSRYVPGGGVSGWPLRRRLVSRAGSVYAQVSLGLPQRDLTGGLKCFARRTLEAIDLDAVRSRGYAFQVELTYRVVRAGLSVREVPITFYDRRAGQSKMSARIALEAAWLVPALRRRAGRGVGGVTRPELEPDSDP